MTPFSWVASRAGTEAGRRGSVLRKLRDKTSSSIPHTLVLERKS